MKNPLRGNIKEVEPGVLLNNWIKNTNAYPLNDSTFGGRGFDMLHIINLNGDHVDTIEYGSSTVKPNEAIERTQFMALDKSNWLLYYSYKNDFEVYSMVTHDMGETWNSSNFPLEYAVAWDDFANLNLEVVNSSIWLYTAKNKDTLIHSVNFGETWESYLIPADIAPVANHSFAFSSESFGLMTCYNGSGLARTFDGGKTWSPDGVERPNRKNTKIVFAKATSTKDALFFIYGHEGCDFSSSDGLWWKNLDSKDHILIGFDDVEHGFSYYRDLNNWWHNCRVFVNNLNTSFVEIPNKNSTLYPNPSNGLIRVNTGIEDFPIEIAVRDLNGKLVRNMLITNSQEQIDLTDLKSGLYFLSYSSTDSTITMKVIIESR